MRIELKGGPFDGHIIHEAKMDRYLIIESGSRNSPRPVYRCAFCECCAHESELVDYQFVGYENVPIAHQQDSSRHDN